jgi:hypothetical protein
MMIARADRAAERLRVKLEEFQRHVKGGALGVREMTPEERWRCPAVPAKARRR